MLNYIYNYIDFLIKKKDFKERETFTVYQMDDYIVLESMYDILELKDNNHLWKIKPECRFEKNQHVVSETLLQEDIEDLKLCDTIRMITPPPNITNMLNTLSESTISSVLNTLSESNESNTTDLLIFNNEKKKFLNNKKIIEIYSKEQKLKRRNKNIKNHHLFQ